LLTQLVAINLLQPLLKQWQAGAVGHQAFGIPAVQAVVEVRPAAGWLGAAGSCMHAPHCLSWHQDRRPEQKHTSPAAFHLTPAYHLLPITPPTPPPFSPFKWRKWARPMLLGELALFWPLAVSLDDLKDDRLRDRLRQVRELPHDRFNPRARPKTRATSSI